MNNVSIHTFHLDHKMAMPVGPLRISYCLCSIVLLPLFYWLSLTLLHTDKSVGMFYFLFCWHTLMSCRWGAVHTLQLKSWRNKQQPSSMPTSATQPPHVFLFLFCPSGFLILNVDAPSSPATLYSVGNALVHQNTCTHAHTHPLVSKYRRCGVHSHKWQVTALSEGKSLQIRPCCPQAKWGRGV